jgi:tetratricopeptide (TPR) repeat protein
LAAAVGGTGGNWLIFAEAFQNTVRAGAYYLGKVLIPWPQSNIVVWEMVPGLAISLFIVLAGFALLLMAIWGWRRRDVGIPLLGAIWFAATLAPSFLLTISDFSGGSEIVAVGKFPVAERYLYLPSVGLALIFGWLFCGMFSTRWRKQANWAAIAVVVVLSAVTIYRGYIWSNNLRLWSDTTSKVTTHGPPWNELGRAYLDNGDDDNALQSFRHALTLKNSSPERATIGHNIGTIYLRRQNLAQAETYFTAAIAAKPTFAESHYGLGLAHAARVGQAIADGDSNVTIKNRMNLAVSHFATAIRIKPDFHLARLLSARIQADYGQLLEREGSQQQATVAYRSARAQIDAVVAGIPKFERQQYVDDWSSEVNVDLYQLSARIDANLQRVSH